MEKHKIYVGYVQDLAVVMGLSVLWIVYIELLLVVWEEPVLRIAYTEEPMLLHVKFKAEELLNLPNHTTRIQCKDCATARLDITVLQKSKQTH